MATNKVVVQNKPFGDAPNVRKGAGPISYSWRPQPFQRGSQVRPQQNITCNNKIDNNVTYVYNVLPNGNHLEYVFCDYVV
jgi:hypothetical protein